MHGIVLAMQPRPPEMIYTTACNVRLHAAVCTIAGGGAVIESSKHQKKGKTKANAKKNS